MIQKHPQQIANQVPTAKTPTAPKAGCIKAVQDLAAMVATEVEADYDENGNIRMLAAENLFSTDENNAVAIAKAFISSDAARSVLELRYIDLRVGEVVEYDLFTRIEFEQFANLAQVPHPIHVRGGWVHVFVDKQGKIFQVNSTIRRGRKPRKLGSVISPRLAGTLAKGQLDSGPTEIVSNTLVLSAHEDRLNPIYEVVLATNNPRQLVLFLVDAKTGDVVHTENKLHYRSSRATKNGIAVRTFPRIPDYDKSITDQTERVFIDPSDLPDPTVLANHRFEMFVLDRGEWVPVKANAQGTFEFDPLSKDPLQVSSFSAGVLFEWLNEQSSTLESWGAVQMPKPMPVFVEDPDVENNAYCDPTGWQIRTGKGTGLKNGGLFLHISWDTGVSCHELIHLYNALEAPGKDLPGPQGGAANEATADAFGDLLFDFWNRLKNSDVLGHQFTVQDIINDPGIIGKYCMYPKGIRSQRNKKQYPRDIVNEVHTDGLIVGGAYFDLLVAMASQPGAQAEDVLVTFGKLFIEGTRLLPAHKVLFTDYVRVFTTVDKLLTGGKLRDLIVKAFADHGIKLQTLSASGRRSSGRKSAGRKTA